VLTSSALVPGHKVRADPELSKYLGSVVSLSDSFVARPEPLLIALQAQHVWFGDGCAGMLFEAVSEINQLLGKRALQLAPLRREATTIWVSISTSVTNRTGERTGTAPQRRCSSTQPAVNLSKC